MASKSVLLLVTIMFYLNSFIVTAITRAKRTDMGRYRGRKYQICRLAISKDNCRPVIEYLQDQLGEDSNDPEIFYLLAAAYGRLNDVDTAMKYVRKSVDFGLPFERYLAGPRNLFKPITDSAAFKSYSKKHPVELIHGPMVGAVTPTSAKVWVRTAHEVPFRVLVSTSKEIKKPISSNSIKTSSDVDFTGVVEVKGLKPDTRYYYRVLLDNEEISIKPEPSFRTYPAAESKVLFKVCFSGGASYQPKNERIWDTILSQAPLAFLFLGDNTYFNIADVREHQEYIFYRRRSRPEFRRLAASTAIYAIWDDHDFAGNDSVGGPMIDKPVWKKEIVWPIFKENFVNPYYGGGDTNPGCWFDFFIGDVDFFMLDGRYYRTDPRGEVPLYVDPDAEYPSMLGPVQKHWLLDRLKNSKAVFKVIASPVPWAFNTKGGTQNSANLGGRPGAEDTWQGFAHERQEIFSFIEKNKIEGVVLLSADRHRCDAWKIERESGYDFYEFESSHLTVNANHPQMAEAIFSIIGRPAFGMLTFDLTKEDPEVTYDVVKIDNEIAASITIKKSQLSFSNLAQAHMEASIKPAQPKVFQHGR